MYCQKLITHLLDGKHGQGGKQERKHGSNQDTRHDNGFRDIGRFDTSLVSDSRQEGKRSKDGRSNSETLSSGGGGVTKSIKGIGGSTDTFVEFSHFGNTSGIVSNGTVGIGGKSDSKGGKHTNGGHGDTVSSREGVASKNGGNNNEDGEDGRDLTNTKTLDDDGGRTGDTSFGDGLGRPVGVGSEVFGDLSDQNSRQQSNEDASVDLPSFGFTSNEGCPDDEGRETGDQDGGDKSSLVEGKHKLVLVGSVLNTDSEVSDKGGDNTDSGNPDWKHDHGTVSVGKSDSSNDGSNLNFARKVTRKKRHSRVRKNVLRQNSTSGNSVYSNPQKFTYKGLEQIGSHTGNISNVVTHIVSNDGRVSWIVLRDVHLDLSDQIGTDIGGLGVDTSCHTGEEGDGRGTESESGQGFGGILQSVGFIGVSQSHDVEHDGDTKEGESHDGESHDGTTGEGHTKSDGKTLLVGGLGGSDIGIGGDLHSSPSREGGKTGSDHEATGVSDTIDTVPTGGIEGVDDDQCDGHSNNKEGEVVVFGVDECVGTLLDFVTDLVHEFVTTGSGFELYSQSQCCVLLIHNGNQRKKDDESKGKNRKQA